MADEIKRDSEAQTLPRLCYDGYVNGEVNEDFLLPDYLPQIDRVLRFEYRAIPDEKYFGTRSAEFSGAVSYNVVYASGDSGICSVSLSSDYDGKAEIPCDFTECRVSTGIENAACRLLGPRKLSTRAKLRTRLLAFSEDETGNGEERTNGEVRIDRLQTVEQTCESRFFDARDIRVDDCIEENGGKPVFCNASVLPTSVTAGNNAVVVSGDVVVRALFEYSAEGQTAGGGRYGNVSCRIPFERAVRCDGVKPGDRCLAEGCCVSVTIGEGEKENSSDCSVNFDMMITAERKKEITLCRDAYAVSPVYRAECSHKNAELYNALVMRGNFTLSAVASRKDIGGENGEIVDVSVYPEITSAVFEKNKTVFSGNARINVIMKEKTEGSDVSGGQVVSSGEFSYPFKYECDMRLGEGEPIYLSCAEMISARGRIDGDKVRVESEIALSSLAWGREKMQIVDKVSVSEADPNGNGITVIYSDGREDLWQIAKRYRTDVESILADNDLGTDRDKRYVPEMGMPVVINTGK
ncbi:MAG: DUF3794 domain-containing protein [Clostridia bacterium]|nr:DUF3794 domain-containing protein [Clostridia bacterium]